MSDGDTYEFVSKELALNYHLMHPGGDSSPGDCNAAVFKGGIYHMHYILRHPWQGEDSFSFVHVTSPDMLHWTWQTTVLQPSFTGHGMFSGTALLTKEGAVAAIYHGQASGRNQIAIAKDDQLSAWERPYPVEPRMPDGSAPEMHHWDPDAFLVGDTYYAISGGANPPLLRSQDLVNWEYVGDFLRHELPDVVIGEDISCPNFFPIDDRWMLLCISHPFGCRYYLGDWDQQAEQFVPDRHERMNWRRPNQGITETNYRDFFAPESLLTPDGRRVMWAWLCTLEPPFNLKTIQSLPRELSLGKDGSLRMRPLRELESLRHEVRTLSDICVVPPEGAHSSTAVRKIAELEGDAWEIRLTIDRAQTVRKRFGLLLFADDNHEGLPVIVQPDTRTIRLGTVEAPFAVADLPEGEDIELRIFIDKYLVEVFVCDRQALVCTHANYQSANGLLAYAYGGETTIRTIEIWKLKATNEGFFKAQLEPIWEPDRE
jgi:beta-fructofuranosidase